MFWEVAVFCIYLKETYGSSFQHKSLEQYFILTYSQCIWIAVSELA